MSAHYPTLCFTVLLSFALAFMGCFDDRPSILDASSKFDGTAELAPSLDVFDAANDVTANEGAIADQSMVIDGHAQPDALEDAPAARDIDDTGPRCASDRDCSDPAAPRCQVTTGLCVRCIVSDDCPRAQRCDTTRATCEMGCATDTDCRRNADDAGAGASSRCDPVRAQCIECASDDECPVRTICTEGQCVPGCNERRGCSIGETCCSNVCTDVARDIGHCGACGTRCQAANGTATCAAGRCVIESCTEGFADCNGDLADGCEVMLTSDNNHCGRCRNACAMVPNARVACAASRCGFTCNEGYADCDGTAANGCERHLEADPSHCGRCGNACATRPGTAATLCGIGLCGFSCMAGLANCDGDPMNGCETNTRSTVVHCGTCDNVCPERPHATAVCDAARCVLRCESGWGDCDGDPANGCEVDLTSTTEHCGRCGARCMIAGGSAACVRSMCTVAACGVDFADCDGAPGNGCETDLRSNASHCGMCTVACTSRLNAAPTCTSRACSFTCNAGFADCNTRPDDGCEVDLRSTAIHCGACGRRCVVANGNAGCAGGACVVTSCEPGFADCDRNAANGCEVNLERDPANCGACGRRVAEICDGRDNSCDGRIDEGCPVGLTGIDGVDFTSPTYGSGSGTAYNLSCPAGTFARSVSGLLYSGFYQSQFSFRCVRPRLVEDRTRTPFAYSIAWDDAGAVGPAPTGSGSAYTYNCTGPSVLHRVSGYVFSSVVAQLTYECASWGIEGSPATGWRVTRVVTGAPGSFGQLRGTRFDFTCPNEGVNASAMRSIFGLFGRPYVSSVAFRCTGPSVSVR